jgi:hypothetical protein
MELSIAVVIGVLGEQANVDGKKKMSRESFLVFMRGIQSLYSKINSHSCQAG